MLSIQKSGRRLTSQRKVIYGSLTRHPQSVAEIIKRISQKGADVDKVTVYRNLDYMVSQNIVSRTILEGREAKYELTDTQNHHHHLVCKSCGNVDDISLDEDILLKSVRSKTKFNVESHMLEFFGKCVKCQK